jgi:long-subunit fatty acid transport protein
MRIAASLIVITAVAAPAAAGGFGIPEFGARRTGMGAVVGRPDEPSAVIHNPAGLSMLGGVHVYASMGIALLDTSFRLRPWDQSERFIDAPVDAEGYYPAVEPTRAFAVIPMIVVTADLWKGKLFGALSTYVPNGTGAKFSEDAVTRYHLIDGYVISPMGQVSAAYKIRPDLSVGAGFGMMKLMLKGRREIYPIINGGDASVIVGSNPKLELEGSAWAPSWNAGVLWQPIPRLTIGATVVGRVDATLKGPLTLTYGDDAGEPNAELHGTHETKQMLPWTFMVGANFDLTPNVEIGSELRYWLYRQYDVQHTDVNDIWLVREIETRKDYRDSWSVSGGVRVHDVPAVPGLELMLGTHYDRTPAPTKSVTLDSPSFTHIGLHSGARYQIGRYRLGLTYLHYWYLVPDIEDSMTAPPSNIEGRGSNNIFTVSFEAMFGAR